ncbi:hypothetical protein LN650_25075 [Klebsiella pneumoniae subsp. pneumoniae]|nr:hypothetical protein [Klebsiella pneumoniae subsp. pneumoniae]
MLNAQIEQQRKSLEGNTILQDTLQKQRDYVTAWSNRLEHQLQLLQEAVNSKRLTLTEKPPRRRLPPTKRRVFRPTRWSSRSWIFNHPAQREADPGNRER